jgi:lipid-binding SYLF domain-containing protein
MKHSLVAISLGVAMSAVLGAPTQAAEGLQQDVDQAVTILEKFRNIPEKDIPDFVLRDARGLAILTAVKVGFIVTGEGGKGLVVARHGKSWTGPSAIGTGGIGVGFQAGGQVSELIFVLNTDEAVKAFSREGNVKLGADVSVAAGPIGRDLNAGVTPVAAVYTYSRSQGLFAGVSLEGTVIATRTDANTEFYGKPVTPDQILSGAVKPPPGAAKLIRALEKF